MEPLFVPQDQEPVKTLLRVYREHTGDMRPPGHDGRPDLRNRVAPRGVAFGAALPGDPKSRTKPTNTSPLPASSSAPKSTATRCTNWRSRPGFRSRTPC
jgi:hypothetical protein